MRLLVGVLLLVGVIAASPDPAQDAKAFDPGPAIRSAVDAHFGHWDSARRASFERGWARYETEAHEHAGDRDAIDLAATRLLATLHNAHSGIYDTTFFETRPWHAAFDLQYAEGAWIATGSRTPEVSDGARLVSVDGVPADTYFRDREDLIYASSEREARGDMLGAIYRSTSAHGVAHLSFDGGQAISLDNASSWASRVEERVRSRWLVSGKVAYVAIPSFGDPSFEQTAIQTIREAWSARALVIDVRGNNGGTTPAHLTWLLGDRSFPWWRETSTAPQPARALAKPGRAWPVNPQAYRGRVVVLADERCVSSCEDFLMPLVVSHRARFVGVRTAGSTGMPYVAELEKGVRLFVGSVHASFPNGAPFEGVGIEPTDPVQLRIADVRAHRDVALERALALAQSSQ